MNSKIAIEAFRSTGHLTINKALTAKFGLLKAGVISNYVDKHEYFESRTAEFDSWFYLRHSDIISQLGIKETTVIKLKKELIEEGIIETKMRGAPAKEFIRIDFDALTNIIFTDPGKTGGLDPGKSGGLYIRKLNNKDNIVSAVVQTKEDFKITLDDFEKFWKDYPSKRRGSQGKALSSWLKLCTPGNTFRPEWQRVRAAIIKQKKSDQWKEEKLIPLASTWLNNKRWLDDPASLKRYRFADKGEEQNTKSESTALFHRQLKEELENS